MAYNPTTQVISAPVSLGDIASALGGGDWDLGTLCTSVGINAWAKYKPVRSSATGILTDAQRSSARYGMRYSSYVLSRDMAAAVADGSDAVNAWRYEKPRGGGNNPVEWYRALDFDGYWGGAEAPVRQSRYTRYVKPPSGPLKIEFDGFEVSRSDILKLSDIVVGDAIADVGEMYLSMCIYNASAPAATAMCITSMSEGGQPIQIKDGYRYEIGFSSADFTSGTWCMFLFASSHAITTLKSVSTIDSDHTIVAPLYIPLAYADGAAMSLTTGVTIVNGQLNITYTGSADRCSNPSGGSVHYNLAATVYNYVSTVGDMTGITVRFTNRQAVVIDSFSLADTQFSGSGTTKTATVDGTRTLPPGVTAADIYAVEYYFTVNGTEYRLTEKLTDNPANS